MATLVSGGYYPNISHVGGVEEVASFHDMTNIQPHQFTKKPATSCFICGNRSVTKLLRVIPKYYCNDPMACSFPDLVRTTFKMDINMSAALLYNEKICRKCLKQVDVAADIRERLIKALKSLKEAQAIAGMAEDDPDGLKNSVKMLYPDAMLSRDENWLAKDSLKKSEPNSKETDNSQETRGVSPAKCRENQGECPKNQAECPKNPTECQEPDESQENMSELQENKSQENLEFDWPRAETGKENEKENENSDIPRPGTFISIVQVDPRITPHVDDHDYFGARSQRVSAEEDHSYEKRVTIAEEAELCRKRNYDRLCQMNNYELPQCEMRLLLKMLNSGCGTQHLASAITRSCPTLMRAIENWVIQTVGATASQLCSINGPGGPSVLRTLGVSKDLRKEDMLSKAIIEFRDALPFVHDLFMIMCNPPDYARRYSHYYVAMMYGMAMYCRCPSLSALQKVNSAYFMSMKANNDIYTFLNKLGVTLPAHSKTYLNKQLGGVEVHENGFKRQSDSGSESKSKKKKSSPKQVQPPTDVIKFNLRNQENNQNTDVGQIDSDSEDMAPPDEVQEPDEVLCYPVESVETDVINVDLRNQEIAVESGIEAEENSPQTWDFTSSLDHVTVHAMTSVASVSHPVTSDPGGSAVSTTAKYGSNPPVMCTSITCPNYSVSKKIKSGPNSSVSEMVKSGPNSLVSGTTKGGHTSSNAPVISSKSTKIGPNSAVKGRRKILPKSSVSHSAKSGALPTVWILPKNSPNSPNFPVLSSNLTKSGPNSPESGPNPSVSGTPKSGPNRPVSGKAKSGPNSSVSKKAKSGQNRSVRGKVKSGPNSSVSGKAKSGRNPQAPNPFLFTAATFSEVNPNNMKYKEVKLTFARSSEPRIAGDDVVLSANQDCGKIGDIAFVSSSDDIASQDVVSEATSVQPSKVFRVTLNKKKKANCGYPPPEKVASQAKVTLETNDSSRPSNLCRNATNPEQGTIAKKDSKTTKDASKTLGDANLTSYRSSDLTVQRTESESVPPTTEIHKDTELRENLNSEAQMVVDLTSNSYEQTEQHSEQKGNSESPINSESQMKVVAETISQESSIESQESSFESQESSTESQESTAESQMESSESQEVYILAYDVDEECSEDAMNSQAQIEIVDLTSDENLNSSVNLNATLEIDLSEDQIEESEHTMDT